MNKLILYILSFLIGVILYKLLYNCECFNVDIQNAQNEINISKELSLQQTDCNKEDSSGYLKKLFDLLDVNKGERKTKVLINNDDKYKIVDGIDYTKLNDHSDIIDCYTNNKNFVQNTPNLKYLENKLNNKDLNNLLDVIYYGKDNSIEYPWSTPIKLGNIDYDGNTKQCKYLYDLVSTAKKTVTIVMLRNIDPIYLYIINNALKEDVKIRILCGGPPGYATIKYMNEAINILSNNKRNKKNEIIYANHIADTPMIWNHSKFIIVDGSSIILGSQNLFEVYTLRNYNDDINTKGPISDTWLSFFTNKSIHIINFCNQLFYQSINNSQRRTTIYKNGNIQILNINDIKNFSDIEIEISKTKRISDTIFNNNPIKFKGMFTFKYNNTTNDLLSIDADEQSRLLSVTEIAKETIYISQQKLVEKSDISQWKHKLLKALANALNKGIKIKCILSRPDYNTAYSSNLTLHEFENRLILNGCKIENLKNYELKYFAYVNDPNIKSAQHTKMWCIDERLLSVSSHNWYGSPLQQSGIIFDSQILIKQYLEDDFWSKWKHAIDPTDIQ